MRLDQYPIPKITAIDWYESKNGSITVSLDIRQIPIGIKLDLGDLVRLDDGSTVVQSFQITAIAAGFARRAGIVSMMVRKHGY